MQCSEENATRPHRPATMLLSLGLATVLATGACTSIEGAATTSSNNSTVASAATSTTTPTTEAFDSALPTAPESARVDTAVPSFSNPTIVDNPWFPISQLHSALLLGNDEGHPMKIETVLLPEPKIIEVDGQQVETLVSQFVSYLDGRIHEVALDWYAQADDGSVWYFGEDVFNYEDGIVADTDGTWIAGRDGPAGMIMPADPQLGDAYRPENIPDFVFEEVVVESVGLTVDGPGGPVDDAIVGRENHLIEGFYEDKTFAPGYGEFLSGVGSNVEAMALAVPTDALARPVPTELAAMSNGATEVFETAEAGDWEAAAASLDAMGSAWADLQATVGVPPLLAIQMTSALESLAGDSIQPAVEAHNPEGARERALEVALAGLDLQLQYRPSLEIDQARFELWANRLAVDSGSDEPDPGHVAGDVTVLEWIWDRIAHSLADDTVRDIETQLDDLRTAADGEDIAAASELATQLVNTLAGLNPRS